MLREADGGGDRDGVVAVVVPSVGESIDLAQRWTRASYALPNEPSLRYLHSVPKRKKVRDCRISLTFREIA